MGKVGWQASPAPAQGCARLFVCDHPERQKGEEEKYHGFGIFSGLSGCPLGRGCLLGPSILP
jgi:hypothetical protein